LAREQGDLGPVIAFGGHAALLGQDQAGQGQAAGDGGEVQGTGENGLGSGQVTFQQERNTLRVQHRRPVRAGRAQSLPGGLRVAPHLADALAAQDRAQVGERGLHRASVRKDPGRGRAFRRGGPALGLAGLAEEREDQ
jgi:hypothetical protein